MILSPGGKLTLIENGMRVFAPWHFIDDDLIVVFDQMHLNVPCVKDCIEQVVSQLAMARVDNVSRDKPILDGRRLIYRDHEGVFNEVVVVKGKFDGFKMIGVHTLEEAIDLIRISLATRA